MYANTNSIAFDARLVPRNLTGNGLLARINRKLHKWMLYWTPASELPADERFQAPDTGGHELSTQAGTPYRIFREALFSPSGLPCTPQPWGSIVAMDLNTGKKLWSEPLGTMIPGGHTGSISSGGPILTGGDLLFSASTSDPYLLAFDPDNGHELWRGSLPGAAQATPMTYQIGKRQFVVVSSGVRAAGGGPPNDAVVAFSLPETPVHGRSPSDHRR